MTCPALFFIETISSKQDITTFAKDVSWLWRTAYNIAVQGCNDWGNGEDQVSDLFDLSKLVKPLQRVLTSLIVSGS